MTIDGPKIIEIKRFKKHPGGDKSFQGFFGTFGQLIEVITDFQLQIEHTVDMRRDGRMLELRKKY